MSECITVTVAAHYLPPDYFRRATAVVTVGNPLEIISVIIYVTVIISSRYC